MNQSSFPVCTVGDLRDYIREGNLSDKATVYVQMPYTMTVAKLKRANLSEGIKKVYSEFTGDSLYIEAWGPMIKRGEDNLYIEIYY